MATPVSFGAVSTTSDSASGGSISLSYPSGVAAGSSLLLCAVISGPASYTNPSGFTLVNSASKVNNQVGASLWTRQATSSLSGSITLSVAAGDVQILCACMLRYEGAQDADQFGASVVATSPSANATSPTPGTLATAPGPNDMAVRMYCFGDGSSSASITGPGSPWTNRINHVTSTTPHVGLAVFDQVGAVSPETATCSTSGGWVVFDIVVQGIPAANNRFLPFFM